MVVQCETSVTGIVNTTSIFRKGLGGLLLIQNHSFFSFLTKIVKHILIIYYQPGSVIYFCSHTPKVECMVSYLTEDNQSSSKIRQ